MPDEPSIRPKTRLRPVRSSVLAAFDGVGPKLLGTVLPLRPTASAREVFAADSPVLVPGAKTRSVKMRRKQHPHDGVQRSSFDPPGKP
jgi:hypothetical protein